MNEWIERGAREVLCITITQTDIRKRTNHNFVCKYCDDIIAVCYTVNQWRAQGAVLKCSDAKVPLWSGAPVCDFCRGSGCAIWSYSIVDDKNVSICFWRNIVMYSAHSIGSSNKDKIMTTIFIFTHFGLNIHHAFVYCVTFVRLCLYNREISLAVMFKQLAK